MYTQVCAISVKLHWLGFIWIYVDIKLRLTILQKHPFFSVLTDINNANITILVVQSVIPELILLLRPDEVNLIYFLSLKINVLIVKSWFWQAICKIAKKVWITKQKLSFSFWPWTAVFYSMLPNRRSRFFSHCRSVRKRLEWNDSMFTLQSAGRYNQHVWWWHSVKNDSRKITLASAESVDFHMCKTLIFQHLQLWL